MKEPTILDFVLVPALSLIPMILATKVIGPVAPVMWLLFSAIWALRFDSLSRRYYREKLQRERTAENEKFVRWLRKRTGD